MSLLDRLMASWQDPEDYTARQLAKPKVKAALRRDRQVGAGAIQRLAQAQEDAKRERLPAQRPARVGWEPPIDPLARTRKRWALT